MTRVAVLGLGNGILRDDSVGLRVAERVEQLIGETALGDGAEVRVFQDEAGGWDVLDIVEGFDALVIVDASTLEPLEPGETRWYEGRAFLSARLGGPHSTDMFTALDYGRTHGLRVPDRIRVLGIGVEDVQTFSEECTPRVARAVPAAAEQVLAAVRDLCASRWPA